MPAERFRGAGRTRLTTTVVVLNLDMTPSGVPSGMFWSEAGAENILALRCINRSRRLDEFWKHRLNALAASNDVLPLKAAA